MGYHIVDNAGNLPHPAQRHGQAYLVRSFGKIDPVRRAACIGKGALRPPIFIGEADGVRLRKRGSPVNLKAAVAAGVQQGVLPVGKGELIITGLQPGALSR